MFYIVLNVYLFKNWMLLRKPIKQNDMPMKLFLFYR